jgi:hypothetical protein
MSISNMFTASVWLFVTTTAAAHEGHYTILSIAGTYIYRNQNLMVVLGIILPVLVAYLIEAKYKNEVVRIGEGIPRE